MDSRAAHSLVDRLISTAVWRHSARPHTHETLVFPTWPPLSGRIQKFRCLALTAHRN